MLIAEQAHQNYINGISEWLEISEEYYWHLLECVPPIFMDSNSFMNSEPYCHSDTWEGVYMCCCCKENRYYFKLMTKHEYLKEFRNHVNA